MNIDSVFVGQTPMFRKARRLVQALVVVAVVCSATVMGSKTEDRLADLLSDSSSERSHLLPRGEAGTFVEAVVADVASPSQGNYGVAAPRVQAASIGEVFSHSWR